jgi:hypothetical protein
MWEYKFDPCSAIWFATDETSTWEGNASAITNLPLEHGHADRFTHSNVYV